MQFRENELFASNSIIRTPQSRFLSSTLSKPWIYLSKAYLRDGSCTFASCLHTTEYQRKPSDFFSHSLQALHKFIIGFQWSIRKHYEWDSLVPPQGWKKPVIFLKLFWTQHSLLLLWDLVVIGVCFILSSCRKRHNKFNYLITNNKFNTIKTKDLTWLNHRFQMRPQKQFCCGIKMYDTVWGLFVCLNIFCTRSLRILIIFPS